MAAATLEAMGKTGKEKLTYKAADMKISYDEAKEDMKKAFGDLPFGPKIKEKYNRKITSAVYTAPDPGKWEKNWLRAMSK